MTPTDHNRSDANPSGRCPTRPQGGPDRVPRAGAVAGAGTRRAADGARMRTDGHADGRHE